MAKRRGSKKRARKAPKKRRASKKSSGLSALKKRKVKTAVARLTKLLK